MKLTDIEDAIIAVSGNNNDDIKLKRLLKENPGVNLNYVDDTGYSPLILASEFGHVDIMRILIKYKADVNYFDNTPHSTNQTPLIAASIEGHYKAIELLLHSKANPDLSGGDCDKAIALAAQNFHADVVRLLAESNANVNATIINSTTMYSEEILNGKKILKDIGPSLKTPLHFAAEEGDTDTIRVLLKHDADPQAKDYAGRTPLDSARANARAESITVLSDFHDKKATNSTPIKTSKILKHILNGASVEKIKKKIQAGYSKVPLFKPLNELKNKTLFEYLVKFGKLKKWTLKDFIKANAVDLEEKNGEFLTLVQLFIKKNDVLKVRMLLFLGAKLSESDLAFAEGREIKKFLKYRPGSDECSIFEFCSKRHRESDYLHNARALLRDQADTTDNTSSDVESMSSDSLSEEEEIKLNDFRTKNIKKYNKKHSEFLQDNQLCLVAARGVHFSPKYFTEEACEKVKKHKREHHITYSQSTLFDAGYKADDEVSEDDKRIVARHKHNVKFINTLKDKDDHKEKNIKGHAPAATRNDKEFENLYYRFMQVYINSYHTLFNIGSIKIDFGFDSLNNPLISASWNVKKAAMYASGFRFEWEKRKLRKDPHYRRFTGKPKHPNLGYIDLYIFDVAYVREQGFDRQIMCAEGHIKLSAYYRAEAEIIFNSMISKEYHLRRCIIGLPSFDKSYKGNKNYFAHYGITSKELYITHKENIQGLRSKKDDKYKKVINSLTESTANAQAEIIEKTTHCRLFRSKKPKVIVYDHGSKLKAMPFKI